MNTYNEKNCDERHDNIGKEFENVKKTILKLDNRLWAIIVLLVISIGVQLLK